MDTIFVAKESFTTTYEGNVIVVNRGITRVREGHPLLKGREQLFEPLRVHYEWERAVEAPRQTTPATATPAPTARPKTETRKQQEPAAASADGK